MSIQNQSPPCPLCGLTETKADATGEHFVCEDCGHQWPNESLPPLYRSQDTWTDEERAKFEELWNGPNRRKMPYIECASVGGSSLTWLAFTDVFLDVKAFHKKFELAYDGPPRELEPLLQSFRTKFLHEELQEYEDGVLLLRHAVLPEERADAAEKMIDSLVDLVYVAVGTAYMHGFDFNEAWRRVQNANMAKVRALRASDSKRGSTYDVIKPEGWTPPTHADLVAGIRKFDDES